MNVKWLDINKIKPKNQDMCCVLLDGGAPSMAIWEGLDIENQFWILDDYLNNTKVIRWFKVPGYNRYIK